MEPHRITPSRRTTPKEDGQRRELPKSVSAKSVERQNGAYLQAQGGRSLRGEFCLSEGKSAPRGLRFEGLQFVPGPATLGGSTTPMKKLVISALLLVAGSLLFTSCTSVPQDNTKPATTTVAQDNK
jgi:hypothetical protein